MAFKVPNKYRDRITPGIRSTDDLGCNGMFIIPHFRIKGYQLRVMASDGMGWEHVSVTVAPINKHATRCPTWEEMCWVKDQFWDDTDCVVQYHPPKSDYVSMHHFCLHMWRPTDHTSVMRGIAVTVFIIDGKYSCKIGNGYYNWNCDKPEFDQLLQDRLTEIYTSAIKQEIKEIHKVLAKKQL